MQSIKQRKEQWNIREIEAVLLDDQYMLETAILYEKLDQNYLCQIKDEALCQIIKFDEVDEYQSM